MMAVSPGSALAQQAAGASDAAAGSGEVVVTARRREESAQKVPVAITALSSKMLEERHIGNQQDLQGEVPALSVSSAGQSRDVQTIAIRGQGTNYTAPPAVITYLAEVPLVATKVATLQGPPGQFLDLANVQVLRGPQGTLFGRNSTGGAVLLEPAKPTDKYEGYFQFQAGNYRDREVEGVVNVPITDTLAVRLAGRFVDREGYTRDVNTGVDYDNRRYWTGRIGVMWKPGNGIENYLLVTGTQSRSNGTGSVTSMVNATLIDAVLGQIGYPGGCAGAGLGAGCAALTEVVAAQNQRGPRRVALGPTPASGFIEGFDAIDQLKIPLSETLTLRNIVSYGRLRSLTPFDGDGTPFGIYQANFSTGGATDDVRQLTEEIQLQGTALDNHLQYTGGFYYENVRTPDRFTVADAQIFLGYTGAAIRYRTNSKAVYGQASLDFGAFSAALEGLKLTGGIRYTWDRSSGVGAQVAFDSPGGNVLACTNGIAPAPTSIMDCALSVKSRSSAPTWTAGLDYQATRDVLVYAKVSRGYKTGGINLYAVNPASISFNPEYDKTYEAGVKSTIRFGGATRLVLNADVFKTDYTDIQIAGPDFNPATFASGAAVFNAASASIKGVEVEASLHLTRRFEISGSYSRIDAHYKSFFINAANPQLDCTGQFVTGRADLSCVAFPYTPKDQYNVSARYTQPLPNDNGDLVVSAVYAFTGRQYQTATTLQDDLPQARFGGGEPGVLIKGYGLLNASISWNRVMSSPIDLSAFVTNATNKRYRVSEAGVFNTLGVESSLYGEPRMYGISARFNF